MDTSSEHVVNVRTAAYVCVFACMPFVRPMSVRKPCVWAARALSDGVQGTAFAFIPATIIALQHIMTTIRLRTEKMAERSATIAPAGRLTAT